MRDGDDHVLALDQVLVLDFGLLLGDDRAPRRGEFGLQRRQFVLDDGLDAGARAQDFQVIGDFGGEFVEFGLDLVAAERGQALQAQIEDRLGLLDRQPRGALG